MDTDRTKSERLSRKRISRLMVLLALGIATVSAVAFFRDPLWAWIAQRAILACNAPRNQVIEEMITTASDPEEVILGAWNSGKIVHRHAAIRQAARFRSDAAARSPKIDAILLAGALDPDLAFPKR